MNAFFTNPNHGQKVYLSNTGAFIQFKDIGLKGGVLVSGNDGINNELRQCAHLGVEEITEARYRELVAEGEAKKKDGSASKPIWREEFKPRLSMDTQTPRLTEVKDVTPAAVVEQEVKLPDNLKPGVRK